MGHIIKSILAHWKRSVGLFIEIIIVTIIGWMLIEPVAVNTSIITMPAGYDHDRLVKVSFRNLRNETYDYDSTANESTFVYRQRILDKIRQRSNVTRATFSPSYNFEEGSYWGSSIAADSTYNLDPDNSQVGTALIYYVPESDYFATFGIKGPDGKPFTEPKNDGSGYIVSYTLAKAKYPNKSAIGQDLYERDEEDDYPTPIIGVIADSPYRKGSDRTSLILKACDPAQDNGSINGIIIRVKDGVSMRKFIDELNDDLYDYKAGNVYLTEPELMSERRDKMAHFRTKDVKKNWIIVIFFLVNVLLGVAGTFFIQCRSRITDAGVMRAFGATRYRIEWNIIVEACITVILAWIIGSALYFVYLHYTDSMFFTSEVTEITRILQPKWYDTAWSRYSIIGGCVLLLLLVSAIIGVWLPARKVGKVAIVEALRDE